MERIKSTLLEDFCRDKLRSYVEPTREGTPKGEPIGFSRAKYEASLAMLTNRRKQEIARNLNVHFGTLRNWNGQTEFLDMILQHAREFSHLLVSHIQRRMLEYQAEFSSWLKGARDIKPERPVFPELEDKRFYSDMIQGFAWEGLSKPFTTVEGRGRNTKVEPSFSGATFDELFLYNEIYEVLWETRPSRRNLGKQIMDASMEKIKEILGKYHLEMEDERKIFEAMLIIEKRCVAR